MESFFTCAHFCPMYGEVTLQCQNFTFMNGSDDGELRGQSCEIWYAYQLLCVIFIFYSLTPFSNMCPVYWLLHYLTHLALCRWLILLHFLCSWCVLLHLVSLAALTGYLLTCVSFLSLYLAHLLLLSWIYVQQPISENGSFTGVSYKERNMWNRNAYQKCKRVKSSEEYGNVCI